MNSALLGRARSGRMAAFKCVLLVTTILATPAWAGSIFLTGSDPDFHAVVGTNAQGAGTFNRTAVEFVADPLFNSFRASGIDHLLYVESFLTLEELSDPLNHTELGAAFLQAEIAGLGLTLDKHDASTLGAALDGLGTLYSGIVVASDVGGLLTQAELDILNARAADIIDFLNVGGGLYAMSESNYGSMLTPAGGHFGFLPFVESTPFDQSGAAHKVTLYGMSLGLTDSDVRPDFTHSVFEGSYGLNVVLVDGQGQIVSLAGRGTIGPGGVVSEPSTLLLVLGGAFVLGLWRRR